MNKLEKLLSKKRTENGDVAYETTGNMLTDIFFMTPFFEKNLNQVKIGKSNKEKIFAMYIRDPRLGLGRRDLGRELMKQAEVTPYNIVQAGRFDDLWHIPTDLNLEFLKRVLISNNNELAKKWLPRLTGKDKAVAKELCKMWHIKEKKYRELIKTSTTEYKLSYAEKGKQSNLDKLFNKADYVHPLVNEINFEQVPSLAMKKYLHCFSTREDIKDRFNLYMQQVKENKKKINVSTTNVVDAKDVAMGDWTTQDYKENKEILGNKIIKNAVKGIRTNAIVVLDTSGSMGWQDDRNSLLYKAMAIAHAISINSIYARNQLISFSSNPRLMTIKGDTLEEQYNSMYTGDCSNTDFGKVMKLLQGLQRYPEYIIVISDMEFDEGSSMSKAQTMRLFRENGARTKIIWWNLNDRNKTAPEFDEYGNIYLSGYNLQLLNLIESKFDMNENLDKILRDYANKMNLDIDF